MRRAALFLALTALSGGGVTATDDDSAFSWKINAKEAHSLEIAEEIETLFTSYQADGGSSCYGYNGCASTMSSTTCDEDYGVTNGCDCVGRAIDKMHTTVTAASEVVASADAKNAVCYTNGLDSYFANIAWNSEAEYKWMVRNGVEGDRLGRSGSTVDDRVATLGAEVGVSASSVEVAEAPSAMTCIAYILRANRVVCSCCYCARPARRSCTTVLIDVGAACRRRRRLLRCADARADAHADTRADTRADVHPAH